MSREQYDIGAAVAQRWKMNCECTNAVVKVGAKGAALNGIAQISIRRNNHPDVGGNRPRSPQMLELTLLQHPKELRLRGRCQLENLIEKQHASCGLFELASLGVLCTSEGAALIPKQLGFKQLLGKSRTVDRDKRALPARRVAMYESGEQLLARASLPLQAGDGFKR
jgi:hypothetical protein